MTGSEYQKRAMRTATPESRVLSNVGLGLAGEAGECADIIKKVLHHGTELDKVHLIKELGDVLWYVSLGCEMLEVSLDDVMQINIDKLWERYPEGFSVERSNNRAEGDI